MNQQTTIHRILEAMQDEYPDFTRQEWMVIAKNLKYTYTAGYDHGYRERSAGNRKRPVLRIKNEEVKEYESLADAARAVKGDVRDLWKVLQGNNRRKTYKGYEWKYKHVKIQKNADQ